MSIGQREGIEANAYVARTDDAGANWYNPAGLAQSEKSAVNASANAYEFTGFALEGADFKRGGKRLSTIGSYVGGVLGAPIIHSRNWRLGFSVTKPVSWTPSRVEGQIALTGTTGDESFLYSTYVSLSTVIPALNVGYRLGDRLRLGVGLGWAHTSLYQNTSLSDRLLTPTSASTALRTSRRTAARTACS